jgi:hypothetical protein
VALQASGLVNKEDRDKDKDKEEVNKAFKLESALSSIKCSYLSLPSAERPSPFKYFLMLS